MQNNIEFKSRKDIPDKYKWDLTDVFADDSAWKNEFESLKTDIPSISVYEDKLGESAETLYECINLSNTLEKRLSQLMIYVYLARDTDLNEGKYQTMYDKVSKLGSDLAAACAFIVPEIISLPEDKVFSYVSNHEKLKDHEHELKDLFREKAHKLDSEKEKLIAIEFMIGIFPSLLLRLIFTMVIFWYKSMKHQGRFQNLHQMSAQKT